MGVRSNITTTTNMVIVCSLLIAITMMIITTLQESHSLRQVVGNITIRIEPKQVKSFTWGLLTDKDKVNAVNISADGTGAEYLSLPKSVDLVPGKTVKVRGNVSVPFDHPGGVELNATLHATEPGTSNQTSGGTGIVDVQMIKRLIIVIGQNPFPEFRHLILKPFIEKANISEKEISIPIESTSNVTDFSFNQNNRSISFKTNGFAGTNGTTIIYPAKLLEAPYFLTFNDKPFTQYDTVTSNKTAEKGIRIIYPHDTMHENFTLSASRIITP